MPECDRSPVVQKVVEMFRESPREYEIERKSSPAPPRVDAFEKCRTGSDVFG